ncbi:MAG: preprotein translocase subunit Sec61beta [Candidatus Kariarchaeaceae archaeon]|jgi:preprotein translocase subunit Sec61beta
MSQRRRSAGKKESAPMPSTGAGLMRYFDEDLPGIKIGPRAVVILTSSLIFFVLLANSRFNPFV